MVDLNFSAGDEVKLKLAKEEVRGTIIESNDSSVFLLKLESGYNVAISKENVLGGRVLVKFKPKNLDVALPNNKNGKKNIGLIITGGTIASKIDRRTGGVKPLTDIGEFSKFYPELFEMVNVKKIEMPFMILSENMESTHWKIISEKVEKMLKDNEIVGVIVTHGTDTLHYTSAALSFYLGKLNKPVVLTYSQRSIDRASSDANLNLHCATKFALSDCAEVVIVGHGSINDDFCFAMRGTKVRKLHTSTRDAFKSINNSPIAKITPEKIEFLGKYNPRSNISCTLDTNHTDKVALVKYYPGMDSAILDFYALKYKGIILEGTGLGHVPIERGWLSKIKKHIREGLVICMTSQCIFGRVNGYVYSNGRELIDAGVIYLEDMLPETAFVKLGWVLGHHGWKCKVRKKMLNNIAGELNNCSYINYKI